MTQEMHAFARFLAHRSSVAAVASGLLGCSLAADLDDVAYVRKDAGSNRTEHSESELGPHTDVGATEPEEARPPTRTPAGPPAFVQFGVGHLRATSVPTSINPTKEGNLIVVAVAVEFHKQGRVVSITDNAPGGSNTYMTANQKSADVACDLSSEIWFAKNSRPGATSVTVTMSASTEIETWVMEFSGLSKTDPLDRGAVVDDGPASLLVTAPEVTPSTARAVVVSTACSCETIASIHRGSPFLNLPIQQGEATAWHITDRVAPWGAIWTSSRGTFNASTVAFK